MVDVIHKLNKDNTYIPIFTPTPVIPCAWSLSTPWCEEEFRRRSGMNAEDLQSICGSIQSQEVGRDRLRQSQRAIERA